MALMTQRSSDPRARRGIGPRGLLLILLALAVLFAIVYVIGRPADAPVANATAEPSSVEPAATATPAASDGFEAGVVAGAAASDEATAAPRITPSRTPPRRAAATATPARKPTATPRSVSRSGLPTIAYDRLPAEARETIRLIQAGGPFPYRQDGVTFQNREGLLPGKPRGYYSEYTVETPGSSDRGARRIIAGEGGELYYTADHYDSFREVVLP